MIARGWDAGNITEFLERAGDDACRPEGLGEQYGLRDGKYYLSETQAQAILEWLAGQIAAAIEIRGLSERLRVNSKELSVVDRTASILTSSNGRLYALLPKVLSEIRKVTNFDRVVLTVIDYQSESIVVKYVWGEDLPGATLGEIKPLEGSRTQQADQNAFRKDYEGVF